MKSRPPFSFAGALAFAIYTIAAVGAGALLAGWADSRSAEPARMETCKQDPAPPRAQLAHPGLKWPWKR